ncbi:serine hydrolase domain-containing protein [Variovorax sp. J22G73]|uniref:serine hydrolase domain-containing protein n=1 Tax=unclassified Variovorax TaxID=663243 RepID=UPI0025758305|nr:MULTISPECIES: serine hydrolase domain-containing protein [unclassified Variovorax]MDM0007922.1 serine hydrolase domain-containing protein [Variovorax sp. J22R203]MDM0100456.1 serine hydrolase domain-containing protein [Variovorax sp. J22G73]
MPQPNSSSLPDSEPSAVDGADAAALAAIDALLAPFARSDAPGLVIGIARHGRLLYRRATGMASLEMGVALTPTTRMRIASTSKHFTAMAVLLLAEDGLLDVEDPVHKHLPEMPALSANGPTLRHLLAHTSGWRGHDELWAIAHGLTFTQPGPGLPAMARQGELNFEPGTHMVYSNGGYHLLAKIVERVSKRGFNDFLKERLFGPLGMPDTFSVATDLDVVPGLAGLYMPAPGGGWQRGVYPCELDGGGSLVSTVDDMLRWQAHMRADKKTVGSAESWALLSAPTTLSSGSQVHYGFGLARHPYRGVDIVHHAGAVLGATSQMLSVPAHGLDIIVMVNGAPVAPSPLALKVVELLLGDALEAPEVRPLASDFSALVGQHYHAPSTGSVLGFADVAGKLAMSWQASPAQPLHQGDGKLWLGLQDLPVNDLVLDAADIAARGDRTGAPDTLVLHEGGLPRRFERLSENAPDAAALADALCGDYASADLDATARMALVDGTLLLTVQGRHGQHVCALTPLSADVMTLTSNDPVLARMGKSVLNVERKAGRVVGLRLDTLRTRNIHLARQESRA